MPPSASSLRRSLCLFLFIIVFSVVSRAQYVTIPDTLFASWLRSGSYSSCMNGNQLDTACAALQADTFFDIHFSFIHDLTGVEYLKNITEMDCDESHLTYISALPPHLKKLDCFRNYLTALPALPATLTWLRCPHNQISALPALPPGLTYLDCSSNGAMPSLPALPSTLTYLDCSYDQIPGTLPLLPSSLTTLNCRINRLDSLPALPASLQFLTCYYNSLTSLPSLPSSLLSLECENNQLTSLPAMPPALQLLSCDNNNLTALPVLPNSITYLTVGYNDITSIPNLPDSLDLFYCRRNLHLTCLPQLGKIGSFSFDSTAITCLGNYPMADSNTVSNSTPPLSSVPLCTTGNVNSCARYTGIQNINAMSFSIYPNPASDIVTLQYDPANFQSVHLGILTTDGKCLISQSLANNTVQVIDIHTLTSGIYFVRLTDGYGSAIRKLVKE